MSRKLRLVFGILIALLIVSVELNVVLYRTAIDYYRGLLGVRLDPTGETALYPPSAELAAIEPGKKRVVFAGDSSISMWEAIRPMLEKLLGD